jgi:hypothetical protein
MTIKKVELLNGNFDYVGGCKPREPEGYNRNAPFRHPASVVASLVYGCYMQSIYLGNPLESCFNSEQRGAHGFKDLEKLAGIFLRYQMDQEARNKVFELIEDQFEQIKENTEFKELTSIDIDDLIASDETAFMVDVEQIEIRFSSFLKKHGPFYKAFVEKLEAIFNHYTWDPN